MPTTQRSRYTKVKMDELDSCSPMTKILSRSDGCCCGRSDVSPIADRIDGESGGERGGERVAVP